MKEILYSHIVPVFPQLELIKLECKIFLLKLKEFKDENNGVDSELVQDFYDIAFVIDECIHQKQMLDDDRSENTVRSDGIESAESKVC